MKPNQIVGMHVSEFIRDQANKETVMELHKRALTGEKSTFKSQFNNKTFTASIGPINDTNNEIIGVLGFAIDITEQEKVKEEIAKSEARYRSLYEAVSGGIVVQDQNGAIVDANAVACELLGLTRDQIQGRTSIDPRWHTIHEDGSPFPGEEHPAMITLRTGKPLRNVTMGVFHPNDNTHRWIQINSEPIIDPQDGKVKFVMTTFLDITKHKKLEEDLVVKEEKYHSLFSSMNEGVCLHQVIYDQAGKPVDYIILDANPAYEVITGIKREDAIGKHASKLYGSGEAPYLQIYAKVAGTGEPTSIGTYFPPLKKYFTISVFSPAKGKFATIFTDTTEQKTQSENLKESKKTFELLFSKNPEAIVLVDKDMHIKEANEAFIQLFGYSQTEIAEANLPDLVVPDNLKQESDELQKNAKQGVVKVETVRKHKDGTEIPVTLSIETIMEQNKFAGFIVVYKDISDIAKTKRTLEKALHETQVLNEKLSVVGSLTRHDVRNKLHGIVGLTYLLEKKLNENSEVTNFIKKINMFVEQTVRILDFSSAYERIGLEQLKMINAEETFNEACALFSEECKSKTSIELNGLYVFADSLLQKVFYNLIDNSLKHGKTVTTIHTYYKEEPNNLKLIYEDNGTGISEADKAQLFTEQFAKGKGAGHGLFMIQKLMDVYGWTIQETGTPDKGAQFTIIIPKKTQKNCEGYKIQ